LPTTEPENEEERDGGLMRPKTAPRPILVLAFAFMLVAAILLAGCGSAAPSSGTLSVVATENFWGSIATQLAGQHASVVSIITNPNTDPHDYEPTAQDALKFAAAKLVIEDGIGYDPWADRLISSSSVSGRLVLNVGDVVGVKPGGNPHQWYSPDSVHEVIAQIAADLKALDPKDAAYFDQQRSIYETESLSRYDLLIADIKAKYGGTPIGASESIVAPLAQALGLDLLTPRSFLNAVSQGTEPTAQDKATIDQQIKTKQINVYIYNSQNAIPDIQTQVSEAKAAGIPVVTITETLEPATATFQDWQVAQLTQIQAALAQATGR
jgi:zinc/manganese transport system substrate-binding protein